MHPENDLDLLRQLATGSAAALEGIYARYAAALFGYARKRIGEVEACEEIVQELFISLWERREYLGHVTNLKAYLYQGVRFRTVNHIAHSTVRVQYAKYYEAFAERYDTVTEEKLNLLDFNETLERSLSSLPENCQKVFRMSRMEHLTIPEIAERMQLNPRTVENYITQALKHLREVWKR